MPETLTERATAALVVNPRASRVGQHGWRDTVRQLLMRRFAVEFLQPRDAEDTSRVARELASQCDVVIAAGGDGTVNNVAEGLAGTDASLGILPLGTANDLARELGIPRDIAGAARRLCEGTPRRVDLGDVNGRVFCTVGGVVLVAQITLMVTRLRASSPLVRRALNALGDGVYRVAATANLLGRRSLASRVMLEYDDADTGEHRVVDAPMHALFVTNHRTLGGGLTLPVEASAQDGVMDLVMVPRRARLSLTVNFARLSAGKPLPEGVLHVVRAREATLRMERDEPFTADGELLASGREFQLAVRPRALRVIA